MPLTPLKLGEDLLDRAEELARLAGSPPKDPWTVQSDVLRAAWTFVGAAVDTYFHERVRGALLSSPMSPSAQKFSVPLGRVDELMGGFLRDRAGSRPRVRLKFFIHDALLKETYQGSTNIERAFSLMGVKGSWTTIATGMGIPVADVKDRLNVQYNRRNRIAHQGDYHRQERRQKLWYDELRRTDVDDEIAWTRRFLQAADLA